MVTGVASVLLAVQGPPQIVETPVLARPIPPTVVSRTMPAFDLDCSLVDGSGDRFRLKIRQRGGRGYVNPGQDHPNLRFRSTRLAFEFPEDQTGLFNRSTFLGGENDGYRLVRVEGSHPQSGHVRLMTYYAEGGRLAAIVHVNALLAVRYAGFCNATRIPQSPLTEAETAQELAR